MRRTAVFTLAAFSLAAAVGLAFAQRSPSSAPALPAACAGGHCAAPATGLAGAAPALEQRDDASFRPDMLIYRPMAPLVEFRVVPAVEAVGLVDDDELVLGVEIDGQARAYPLNQITGPETEVVNDVLAGEPIVVTSCALGRNTQAHSRRVGDATLTFATAGIWRRVLLVRDAETESVWSQLLGRAMSGPREGTTLRPLPALDTDWKTWRARHPNTTVLAQPRSVDHARRGQTGEAGLVLGLTHADSACAWTLDRLDRNHLVQLELGGRPIALVRDPVTRTTQAFARDHQGHTLDLTLENGRLLDHATGSAWEAATGAGLEGPLAPAPLEPLAAVTVSRDAWQRYHPDSSLDGQPAPQAPAGAAAAGH